jgi:hypothetical protein
MRIDPDASRSAARRPPSTHQTERVLWTVTHPSGREAARRRFRVARLRGGIERPSTHRAPGRLPRSRGMRAERWTLLHLGLLVGDGEAEGSSPQMATSAGSGVTSCQAWRSMSWPASVGRRGGMCSAERRLAVTSSRACVFLGAERELSVGGARELQGGGDPVARHQRVTSDADPDGWRGHVSQVATPVRHSGHVQLVCGGQGIPDQDRASRVIPVG